MKIDKEMIKIGIIKSTPIFFSYIFLGIAYGILMEESGFPWYFSWLASVFVFTGAFQFVLTSFMAAGASYLTIAIACFLMGSRHSFYSITFLSEFKKMGRRTPYMACTLSDETYAVDCSLEEKWTPKQRADIMLGVHCFSKSYWVIGAVIGGVLGQIIPYDMTGIDFCMTALFVLIMVEQWENAVSHVPAVLGIACSLAALILFGQNNFMLPALIAVSVFLILWNRRKEAK